MKHQYILTLAAQFLVLLLFNTICYRSHIDLFVRTPASQLFFHINDSNSSDVVVNFDVLSYESLCLKRSKTQGTHVPV